MKNTRTHDPEYSISSPSRVSSEDIDAREMFPGVKCTIWFQNNFPLGEFSSSKTEFYKKLHIASAKVQSFVDIFGSKTELRSLKRQKQGNFSIVKHLEGKKPIKIDENIKKLVEDCKNRNKQINEYLESIQKEKDQDRLKSLK